MIIILLGPDGVGKTTIANALSKKLNYIYFYGGARNPESWLLKIRQKKASIMQNNDFSEEVIKEQINRSSRKLSFYSKTRKYISMFLLIYDGYLKLKKLKKTKKNYVLDRSVIDVFVQNDLMWEWPLKNIVLKYLLKDVDAIHLLCADPLIIYERKQELSIDEIEIQLDKFKVIVDLLNKGKCVNNTLPIDEVIKELSYGK